MDQLRASVLAVFRSFGNPRARAYRELHGIDDDVGTAVNVQAMVFGDRTPRWRRACASRATRRPASALFGASTCCKPRERTSWPACARRRR